MGTDLNALVGTRGLPHFGIALSFRTMAVIELNNQANSRAWVMQGVAALRQSRTDEARNAFERALDADRDCVEAYLALARLRFPGESYLDNLSRLHRALKPVTYVEIGVGN